MTMDDLSGRKALIKAAGLKKGRMLDVGLGNCGCMAFFLAKKGFNVIGIDSSPKAVHVSRKKAMNKKFKGAFEARLANAEKLPFSDNEFDAVSAYHTTHHFKHVQKGIDEMFRVCKEGGVILISDLNEKGRKEYEHKPDNGKFLKILEGALTKRTDRIRKIETRYNMMFICSK
jgi:demethylmenaquinone methyltransferase/2-methoxy-6-polyprenyl-1,4-benzoquinol methylase